MNKSERICFFLPYLGSGGLTKVMLTLAEGFAGLGYCVDVVLTKNGIGKNLDYLIPKNINVVLLSSKRTATSVIPLIKYVKRKKPIAVITGGSAVNCVNILSNILSTFSFKSIVTEHSLPSVNIYASKGIFSKFVPFMMKKLYPLSDKVVSVSKSVAYDLSIFAKIPIENIKVIHNPVITNDFESKLKYDISHEWFFDKRTPVVLYVGRLVPEKNVQHIIKSFHKVNADAEKSAKLLVIGDGEEMSELKKLAKEMRLNKYIDFLGHIANPYPYMKHSDVLVLTSLWEGLPTVLIEAMACGTKVIATDNLSGAKEILCDGKYGTLIPEGNADALAYAINNSLKYDPDDFGVELKKRASYFSLENSLNEYVSLIND